MIEFILRFSILMLYIGILYFVSRYDYDHMQVRLVDGLALVALGVAYMVLTGGHMETLTCLLLLLMIFGLPCLFGFGLGDLLVFISLAPFIASGNILWYLLVFFGVWFIWNLLMIHKRVAEGCFQRYRDAFSKKALFTLEYPLVPVILISFVIWMILRVVLLF